MRRRGVGWLGTDQGQTSIHVSGFSGEDGGTLKLNALSQADAVFSYG
jgi:hypothetical protein